jgi:hypothetical protein
MSDIPVPHASDPVVLPGSNNQDLTDHVCGIPLRHRDDGCWPGSLRRHEATSARNSSLDLTFCRY